MVGASKILTVSYGTFSCTLEGFDDPFSTMKAIAEYFRDLAAADRYFGAEPPTPDAEMLHRIAEREIQRRVEAKISENGVILRQSEPEPAPALAPTPAPAPVVAEVAAPVVAEAPVAEAEPDVVPADDAEPESVAAKLMRIRAAVAAARTAPAAYEEDAAEPALDVASAEPAEDFGFEIDLPDLHRADLHDAGPVEVAAEEPDIAAEQIVDETADEEPATEDLIAALYDETPEVVAEAVAEEPAAEDHDEIADEFELAELAQLDAELSELDAEPAPEMADAAIDETADDIMAVAAALEEEAAEPESVAHELIEEPAAESDADLIASLVAAQEPAAADEFIEDLEEAAVLPSADDDEPAFDDLPEVAEDLDLPELAEEEATAEDMVEEVADLDDDVADEELAAMIAEDQPEDTAEVAEEPFVLSSDMAAHDDEMAEEPVADVIAEDDDVWMDEAEPAVAEVAEDPAEPVAAVEPVAPAPQKSGFLSRARARVIKVRQSLRADDDEDDTRTEARGNARVYEDDLVAALREDPDLDPEAEDRRAALAASSRDEEAVASRLMEEAANKLEGAENRRRFSAIAHLKAAVAATVADRKLKPQDAPAEPMFQKEDEIDAYRDDLSKAVRPRRPVAEPGAGTRRPMMENRPAPLVLVSEQRVDRPSDLAAEGAVVRPRRITSGNLALTDDDDILDPEADRPLTPEEAQNFAEFAERMGASSLPDLLEAAAAYTASVEGRPYFSRPQILKKVAYVADDGDYSREDGLRSFGMLLRQGKIQKVRRGQFALTDNSKFMVEARRAAR